MKTDKNGCSTCPKGEERYESYTDHRGRKLVQYDYRSLDGTLFSCVSKDLETARKKRDDFLLKNVIFPEERKNEIDTKQR